MRQELLDEYAEDYFEQHPDAQPDDPNAVMPEEELNAELAKREAAAMADWKVRAMSEDSDESWTELTGSNAFENLVPGGYILLIRDANDKRNSDVVIQRALTVDDQAIVMTAESTPEHNGNRDGAIMAEAQGGRLNYGTYQFIVRPVEITEGEEEPQLLIQDNETMDILAYSTKMRVWIPAGTLSEGDDLMAMLMPFHDLPQDGEYLVQYTDASGESHPVAWSLVTPGKVYYVAAAPGAYEIVKAEEGFSDVSEDFWGADAISFTAARGLFQGVGEDEFDPSGTMTRSMLVTVLGRLAGVDPADYSGESTFSDVDAHSWYGPYVAWAAENGVVQGVGGDRFAPDDPITREQLCTMLVRYLDSDGIELPQLTNPAAFTDEDQVSDWAKDAVERFRQLGIVEGSDTGAFLPKNNASRAEVAAVFQRLITTILTNI
ncbi:MAG: S-layer homology domain-containing protein [Pseudoflavonifractor capillosus]|uniref:S-layer homology domain-containing protein n=1 Tax=Pseudoflavonifractor capillosus TaxID=106588 RepID=UPI0023F7B5BF|nr:S-layer homology domain-containing protein [Pseudoflavonifractor capillosus]MCI5927450.1 S-layer homology domain-containing protein [Pseudoflavonifractor capillosus]